MILRNPKDVYTRQEVESVLEKAQGYEMAKPVVGSILDRMNLQHTDKIPKSSLNNTEYEILDWLLYS